MKNTQLNNQLLENVREYSEYNGTECINHLNGLMHQFTNMNDETKTIISIKKDYDQAQDASVKESYLRQLLEVVDSLEDYSDHDLKELRFSVIQTNKLLTEIALYAAKTENL